MISESDIYRAANLVIKRHGGGAIIEAARILDRMLDSAIPKAAPMAAHQACDRGAAGADRRQSGQLILSLVPTFDSIRLACGYRRMPAQVAQTAHGHSLFHSWVNYGQKIILMIFL